MSNATAAGGDPRKEILVLGIGNPLRGDDAVGIHLVERLIRHYGERLDAMVVYEADIALAETFAGYRRLLVVDALNDARDEAFCRLPLKAAASIFPRGGFSSHLFDWGMLLAMSRDLFGDLPEAELFGIRAHDFAISDQLSAPCATDADAAFSELCRLLDGLSER